MFNYNLGQDIKYQVKIRNIDTNELKTFTFWYEGKDIFNFNEQMLYAFNDEFMELNSCDGYIEEIKKIPEIKEKEKNETNTKNNTI